MTGVQTCALPICIAVAIQSELGIPVKYVGVGEKIDDLQKFNSEDFVKALFAKQPE